jgi:hypothetical protein
MIMKRAEQARLVCYVDFVMASGDGSPKFILTRL